MRPENQSQHKELGEKLRDILLSVGTVDVPSVCIGLMLGVCDYVNVSAQVIQEIFDSCGLHLMYYRLINRFEQSEAKCFEESVSVVAELSLNSPVPQFRADEIVRNDIVQVVGNQQTLTESLAGIEKILEKHSYTKKIIESTEEKVIWG